MRLPFNSAVICSTVSVLFSIASDACMVFIRLARRSLGLLLRPEVTVICPISSLIPAIRSTILLVMV